MSHTVRGAAGLAGTIAATIAALLTLAGCGGSTENPVEQGAGKPGQNAGQKTVVVGSANFPENVLLGEIYAQALEDKGVKVETKLNIGSREVIYDQIKSGGLTVLPEYNGALLAHVDPETTATETAEVNAELRQKLPGSLELLESSAAEDKDSLTVTAATAQKHDIRSIADLEPVADGFVIGGPPEFKTRVQGLVGLQKVYGLGFESFRSLDVGGPITVAALKQGDIDVANLFTTDPAIDQNGFVILEDPERLFTAQNVTPLVYRPGVNDTVRQTLDEISANLDTKTLSALLERVVTDKQDPDQVARDWLRSQGLR
ncbi:MAG: ABC transporter substrate-binding protein [Carbonactinosporaceae bacterium]